MAVRQGSKVYCQLLFDLHRYKLIEEIAAKDDLRVTALIREFVYAALESRVPGSAYKAAEAADQAMWAESVRRRVEGRMRNKGKFQCETHESQTDA